MSTDRLLRPFQLRRLIVDLENDAVIIDAVNDVGSVQIDLDAASSSGGEDLWACFDKGDQALIKRFASASMRDFE